MTIEMINRIWCYASGSVREIRVYVPGTTSIWDDYSPVISR